MLNVGESSNIDVRGPESGIETDIRNLFGMTNGFIGIAAAAGDDEYIDGRRQTVLRRRENDAACRFNSNCEQTILSKVNEFLPFVDAFDIDAFIR